MTDLTPQTEQTNQSGQNVLDWIVTNYLGSKIQSQHIRNYAGANLAFNHGRDIAQKLGLDPAQITPFPCPTKVSMELTPQQPSKPSALSTIGKAGIAAALIGTGAGMIPIANWAINQFSQKPVPTVPAPESPDANVGFEIR
jgi:hypothetical protein